MSLPLLFLLLIAISVYWVVTQVLPERRRVSLLRPGLADGLLTTVNERRHDLGLPLLELDADLMTVAENKASHQLMTGRDEDGWEYPGDFSGMFGRSLLMEVLLSGATATMGERLARQRDLFDGEWISCGIGVAGGQSGSVVVALVLCREAWEPVAEGSLSLLERLALGE